MEKDIIEQLKEDLLLVNNEFTKSILKREIRAYEHARKMIKPFDKNKDINITIKNGDTMTFTIKGEKRSFEYEDNIFYEIKEEYLEDHFKITRIGKSYNLEELINLAN
jgi:hypothetical protein